MNIEELVNRAYTTWAHEKGSSWTDHMRAALTELAAGYEEQLVESKRKLEVSGYAWSLMGEELNALRGERVPACRGRNCGATDGISHSQECRNEHDAACGYAAQSVPVVGYEQRITDLEDVLRSLACSLSAGGYNADAVDPTVFEKKIRDGIDMLVAPLQDRISQLEAELERLRRMES